MMARRFRSIWSMLWPGLLLIALTSSWADSAERLSSDHVGRFRNVISASISPDGSNVAYVLSVPRKPIAEEDGPAWSELHVVGTDRKSRPFICGDVNVSEVSWSPDGRSILFLAKRGKDEHRSLYQIEISGGEARRVFSFGSDITSYSLRADGRRVAFLAVDPDSKSKAELKKKGFNQIVYEEELHPVRIWLSKLDDPTPPRSIMLPGSASELRANPTSESLAVALAPTPGVDDAFTRRKVQILLGGPNLIRFDNPGKLGKVLWSPDGKKLAMISASDEHDPAPGRLLVGAPGDSTLRDILPDYLGHVSDIVWTGNDRISYIGDEGTATVFGSINADGSAHSSRQTDEVVATSLSVSSDGRTLAIVGSSPKHGAEVYLIKSQDRPEFVRLTDSNPWLSSIELAPQEVITYKARDGLELQGVLVRPLGMSPGTRVPLVLDVHGGPESHVRNGWVTGYALPGQVLAARGVAVFLPNYRGSTGRGVAFSKLGQADPAGKEFDDLVDAVDFLIADGLVDGSRVGVTGGSYGGYATAWCSTRYSDRFAAGVMFVGISDKISKTGTTDIPDEEFLVHARKRPWDDWLGLLEHSPIFHVETARTPLLIMHGKDDPRVFPGQSLELYRFLKIRGQAPVRLVLYPGEGHGNLRAASRLDYNLRMIQWLTHYLQGPGGSMPPSEIDYGVIKADGR
ncbi:prolyl oligopeptidase family serine peptidase [Tundrisphaera lichenicola]|uniref:prolyl oligopeptidase family serine peptidase n=1 Tax=Tundrisphaera lichenicola TaxID=2029860 RepID=UPI003EBF026F